MSKCLLATMITTTSFGTWLPGDLRGYVEGGTILPHDPERLELAKSRMKGTAVYFTPKDQAILFKALVGAANEFEYHLICASIESWHLHWLIDHGFDPVATMVGRLKTRMRKALNRGRIWTAGYDKRYCFTPEEVEVRKTYINRHHGFRQIPISSTQPLNNPPH